MISGNQIKPDAFVVCSKNVPFAAVDHMEGTDTIKLKKDELGQHHYIPLSWVTKVDETVHINRPGDQAMKEWSLAAKVQPKDLGQPKALKDDLERAALKNKAATRSPAH